MSTMLMIQFIMFLLRKYTFHYVENTFLLAVLCSKFIFIVSVFFKKNIFTILLVQYP